MLSFQKAQREMSSTESEMYMRKTGRNIFAATAYVEDKWNNLEDKRLIGR